MWLLCSIATVFIHCEAVTKCNLWYSCAKLLLNQFFSILCVCTTDLSLLHELGFSEFLIVDFTSFFLSMAWVCFESVLSLQNSAVLPNLCRQCFVNIFFYALAMLVVVKTLNGAGPEWGSFMWAHVGSSPRVSAKSTTECTKCEHAHTRKSRDGFEMWPDISYCTTITLGYEHNWISETLLFFSK